MVELDYLAIGHATRDLVNGAFTIGGTVSYAARTAEAMGCRVGVVTSTGPELDLGQALGDIPVANAPAAATTTFENVYTGGERLQVLHAVAEPLTPEAAPSDWRAAIVHLGPVAHECDPALAHALEGAFLGLTPQGWMRRWDRGGRVSHCRWAEADELLPRADAVVISAEDLAGQELLAAQYAAQTRLLVLTRGAEGCTVYEGDQTRRFPAPTVREVDPTGSGDIFAAAFFVWLQGSGDPWAAARFANCVAARSVTREGLSGAPSPEEIGLCKRALKKVR